MIPGSVEQSAAPRGARDRIARVLSALRAHAPLVATGLVVPALVVGFDMRARWSVMRRLRSHLALRYEISAVLAVLVWLCLFEAVRDPRRPVRGAALAVTAFTAAFGIGGQAYFKRLTNGYVNRDALMLATQMQGVIGGWMEANVVTFTLALLAPAVVVCGVALVRARRFGPRRRHPNWLVAATLATLGLATFAPLTLRWFDVMPPDMLLLNATGGPLLYYAHLLPAPATLPAGEHAQLPSVAPTPEDAPSIVLLFGESIRADKLCSTPSEGCKQSPELDRAAPGRIGFPRAHALSSCTELSSTWLFSGLGATATSAEVARAPLLWDYAKARGYRTAYLASQHLGFQNLGIYVRTSHIDEQREARDRGPQWGSDLGSPDEVTTDEALAFVARPGPAFVVVHFSNTHDPYRQVDGFKKAPVGRRLDLNRRNAYDNSVAHHDFVLGDFLRRLRADARGRRAIVLYTSDHGEAWAEHGTVGHTTDMYAEQIDVPLWIDAPAGSLPDAVRAALAEAAPTRVAPMSDVSATVADLLGALDAPELAPFTARLAGTSLLRPAPPKRTTFLWNCPSYRACNVVSYGVMEWPLKFQWVAKQLHYACTDQERDPTEATEEPLERCAALRELAFQKFGTPDGAR